MDPFRQLRFLQDQTVALNHERSELNDALETDLKQHCRIGQLLQLIEDFHRRSATVDLDDCLALFKRLKNDFNNEYKLYGLNAIVDSTVLPLMIAEFSSWTSPLDHPDFGLSLMTDWRALLLEGGRSCPAKCDTLTAYDSLLWNGWLPPIRRLALTWCPKDQSESMITLIATWLSILPRWIVDNLLEQVVLPRLTDQVDQWNPVTDIVPIHHWLHQWLHLMGDRMLPLYPSIRHKLSKALHSWTPSDGSARSILVPWKEVFGPATMDSFLARNILPKLTTTLANMRIDPVDQQMACWNVVFDWVDMLSQQTMVDLLLGSFFPKWQETLCTWLDSPGAKLQEIAEWYSGWRAKIPQQLIEVHAIREQFTIALTAMNRASAGYKVGRPVHEAQFGTSRKAVPFVPTAIPVPCTFKELIEQKALERGVAFMPQVGKFREGKPVYWFGKVSVFLDRNVLFAFDLQTSLWSPIGLNKLIAIC